MSLRIQICPKEVIIPKILFFSDGIGNPKHPIRSGGVDRILRVWLLVAKKGWISIGKETKNKMCFFLVAL